MRVHVQEHLRQHSRFQIAQHSENNMRRVASKHRESDTRLPMDCLVCGKRVTDRLHVLCKPVPRDSVGISLRPGE